jgi:hypothetical protein
MGQNTSSDYLGNPDFFDYVHKPSTKTPLNMSEKAVSVVSLKALQPIAKTTYTIDDTAAKALTRKILWKLDTRYFSNHEFHQVPAANDFLQRTPAHYHLISLQLL